MKSPIRDTRSTAIHFFGIILFEEVMLMMILQDSDDNDDI